MSAFSELLTMANYQPEPVKLLFLFAKPEYEQQDAEHSRAAMSAVMCVDKQPNELSDFQQFSAEADAINRDWQFIFITSILANSDSAVLDRALKQMVSDVQTGHNTATYVVLDRDENILQMMRN